MKARILSFALLLFSNPIAVLVTAQTKSVTGSLLSRGMEITSEFIDDKISIHRNDGIAIVNLQGEMVCSAIKPPKKGFSEFFSMNHGVFFAQDGADIVLKDLTGKQLGNLRFEKFIPFITDNTLVAMAGGNYAYIDRNGQEIVRFDREKYLATTNAGGSVSAGDVFTAKAIFLSEDDFPPFSEGLSLIKDSKTQKVGFIDEQFKLLIPARFKNASRFSEGLAAVQDENGNWGYIDKQGVQIIPFSYSKRPSDFRSGLAKVTSKTGSHGFINHKNELVIAAKYKNATNFYKGHALVKETYNSPVQLIDSLGAIVCEFPENVAYIDRSMESAGGFTREDKGEKPYYVSETLQQLVDYGKGIFQNGGYGLLDRNGNTVLNFNYKHLSHYHDGKLLAYYSEFVDGSTRHTYGVIDEQGQWVLHVVESEF